MLYNNRINNKLETEIKPVLNVAYLKEIKQYNKE